ncbi:uncharacterized protein LOC122048580 [Zingiber officinale]|uniref:Uncharacterized protein n=1 Tax=Zingiber officinale TaxID=94328 RepID=A0A8J5LTC3_ZINOF|nr:uncharacterized protein LOC122048580 [Zingiber officinale]KAG6525434.1 hypothetical protein ZIOFF_015390 [Zingiber officinale]
MVEKIAKGKSNWFHKSQTKKKEQTAAVLKGEKSSPAIRELEKREGKSRRMIQCVMAADDNLSELEVGMDGSRRGLAGAKALAKIPRGRSHGLTILIGVFSPVALFFSSSFLPAAESQGSHVRKLEEENDYFLTQKEHWFNQTLDHLSIMGYHKFQQRHYEFLDHYQAPKGPVFLVVCGEESCDGIYNYESYIATSVVLLAKLHLTSFSCT